MLRDSGGASLW